MVRQAVTASEIAGCFEAMRHLRGHLVETDFVPLVQALVHRLGGTISGEHGVGSKRLAYLPLVMDQTVIDLLRQSLGVSAPRRSNGLARLAGSWSERDLDEFEAAVADTEAIDDEMWR